MRPPYVFHLLAVLLLSPVGKISHAIPNTFIGGGNFFGPVIPAQPVFGRDLTRDFFEAKNWDGDKFPGPWREETSLGTQTVKRMTANPTLFGAIPMAVYAYSDEESHTDEIAIHFLDAGIYFGYQFGGETNRDERSAGAEKRSTFNKHYRELSADLRQRLDQGCGRGSVGSIGRSNELRTVFTQYQWEDFILRLVTRPEHSVSIYIHRKGHLPDSFVEPEIAKLADREKADFFSSKVSRTDYGDVLIEGLPMFRQGNTPFCGIHSLAMASHYLGLRVHPETLAAGAEFKNTGSAKGSQIIDLYRGVGEEIDMRVSTSPKFDLRRAKRSIEAGIPIVVWRRVSRERELAHNEFLKAFSEDPTLTIGKPDTSIIATYPPRSAKGSPSHASVITGFNEERNEVIFTEPWGEFSRNRRMRIEEMEATAYALFYFKI
ncbi:MAG: C39 family peptidase [Verrucomicrobiales bacterium]|nr:C39 family peptidase [Verrucomicrobiales bacterium]